jgi:hypothetical protein
LSQEKDKCGKLSDSQMTGLCFMVNRAGGKCVDLSFSCSKRYCSPSSADYIQCKRDHKLSIDGCIAENQHCIENEIDGCIPLNKLNQFMERPLQ